MDFQPSNGGGVPPLYPSQQHGGNSYNGLGTSVGSNGLGTAPASNPPYNGLGASPNPNGQGTFSPPQGGVAGGFPPYGNGLGTFTPLQGGAWGGLPPNNGKGSRKGLWITLIIVGVLLIGGGVFLLIYLNKDKAPEPANTTAVSDSIMFGDDDFDDDDIGDDDMDDEDEDEEDMNAGGESDASQMGFSRGIRSVEFGYEAGYGYSCYFDEQGNLTRIHYFDHGDSGDITVKNGRLISCNGNDAGFGDEEGNGPYHSEYEYKKLGQNKTEVYVRNNDGGDAEQGALVGIFYTDEDGRITRLERDGEQIYVEYRSNGRAYSTDGKEIYPPLHLFFFEPLLLPENHIVKRRDSQNRTVYAETPNGNSFTITYWSEE